MSTNASNGVELICYHGTTREVVDWVVEQGSTLRLSNNDYDWLGPGIYFWFLSPELALHWAMEACKRRHGAIPGILKAIIRPQNCLNLLAPDSLDEVKDAYAALQQAYLSAGVSLPRNSGKCRKLDCAVLRFLHEMRKQNGLPPYDCVLGAFEEGDAIYPGSNIREKSHVQIAVCDIRCITSLARYDYR